jgi:hypothetical protein
VIFQLFLGFAQAEPCFGIAAVPLGGFAEAPGGGTKAAFLEVLVPDGDFLLRLQRIEGIFLLRAADRPW